MSDQRLPTSSTATPTGPRKAFVSVVGVASVVVLFQAVWAGVFVREHQDYPHLWIVIHARGADLAIALALAATVIAFLKLRSRTDLWIGAGIFALLLILEAYLGGLVGPHPRLTIVHFPLGMALMGLSVWLPMRATSLATEQSG